MTKYTPSDKSKGYKKKKPKTSSYDHMLLMKLKKNIFQHEKKFIDVNITANQYLVSGSAAITLLNGIVQGTDENTRIGRQMNIKSIYLKGTVQSSTTTVGNGNIRTIIVVDQEVPQSSGSGQTMAITDFLVSDQLVSLNNLNNRKRFKILHNEVCQFAGQVITSTTSIGGLPTSHYIDFFKKLDITCEFNSNDNGNIGDFTKNAIYLITYTDNLSVANLNTNLFSRVRFTDN